MFRRLYEENPKYISYRLKGGKNWEVTKGKGDDICKREMRVRECYKGGRIEET